MRLVRHRKATALITSQTPRGLRHAALAAKLGISESTIRGWASDFGRTKPTYTANKGPLKNKKRKIPPYRYDPIQRLWFLIPD